MTYLSGLSSLSAPARPHAARSAAYLALLTSAALLAATAPATAGATRAAARGAVAAHTGKVSICRRYQHVTVATAQGARFVVKNDNYGGNTECVAVRGRWPNFTVTRSPVPGWHKKPQAYPFILRGCSWGTCSPDSGLPRQVLTLERPVATWYTSQVPHGKWDAAFDIWFGKHPLTTGQAAGAELMIWLSARHIEVPRRTRVVQIDHTRWYLLHWRACHLGTCWNYIQFRRVRPARGTRHLLLLPFVSRAEKYGWVRPQWWLENIEAGFELWQGGAGLATNWFWAKP